MIDLITVVYQEELPLLQIQAKSLKLYFPDNLVNNIFVIVNDDEQVTKEIRLEWWGAHRNKVRIIHRDYFSKVSDSLLGWESQQLLKLLAANLSKSQYSCTLDAKTWFVRPVVYSDIFDSSNRVNVSLMPMFSEFQSAIPFLSKIFNISFKHIIGPGGVPFYFHTETVRDLIAYIQNTHGSFEDFFCENVKYPNTITEFTLYSAFVIFMDKFYKIYSGFQKYEVLNVAHFELDEFDLFIEKMKSKKILTTSIHKTCYKLITQQQFQNWINFLIDKKLCLSLEIAKIQLNTLRTGVDNGVGIRF